MERKITVIGGANIDICGVSDKALREFDSNPGTVQFSFGGVGRNIAEICAMLGRPVSFVTCFSDDAYGIRMRRDCEGLGIDCSGSIEVSGVPSSMYLAILDEHRDMHIALNDMRILHYMTPSALAGSVSSVNKEDILAVDANLDADTVAYLLRNTECMHAADPVSVSKCGRFADVLDRVGIFKPNRYEAESLSGIQITDDSSLVRALQWFSGHGVKETLISLAEEGAALAADGKMIRLRHRRIQVENATGGGDAMLGGYLCARLEGLRPVQAACAGIAAAAAAIENDAVRRRNLSSTMIRELETTMCIEETELC